MKKRRERLRMMPMVAAGKSITSAAAQTQSIGQRHGNWARLHIDPSRRVLRACQMQPVHTDRRRSAAFGFAAANDDRYRRNRVDAEVADLRRSELLALRWTDFDADAGTLTVAGKLVRATGHGLARIDETKSAAGKRTLPLPSFAVIMLKS